MWNRFAAMLFGLAAAPSWGPGDFASGLAARRSNVFSVTVISQMTGLAVLLAVARWQARPLPAWPDLAWAVAAGVSGTLGLLALWRVLAVGLMSVIAPVAGVLSAVVAVLAGAIAEGMPTSWQVTGFALALAGVWLVSHQDDRDAGRGGLGLAVVAGLGFGGYFILVNQVGDAAFFWPLAFARAASSNLSFLAALGARAPMRLPVRLLPLVVGSGILDVGGNAFFLSRPAGRPAGCVGRAGGPLPGRDRGAGADHSARARLPGAKSGDPRVAGGRGVDGGQMSRQPRARCLLTVRNRNGRGLRGGRGRL